MAIDKDLLDRLLSGRDPRELFGSGGLLDELKKALSERILSAELDDHLAQDEAVARGNRRNGTSKKTVLSGTSPVTLDIPRDRAGTFDPKLIAKYQRRFPEFDDKIISMYARGMSVHLKVLDFNVFSFINDNMQIMSHELAYADASAELWMGDQQWPAVHLRRHLLDVVLSVY